METVDTTWRVGLVGNQPEERLVKARGLDLHNKTDYVFYGEGNKTMAAFPRQQVKFVERIISD